MKKNKLFLLGLFVVFAAVLSLSLVSNTLAKYTSSDSGSDTARVAKWGIVMTVTGNEVLYDDDKTTPEVAAQVLYNYLAAPGTHQKLTTVALTGTPEVAYKITVNVDLNLQNWNISGADYCPLVFNVDGTVIQMDGTIDEVDKLEVAVEKAILKAIAGGTADAATTGAGDYADGFTYTQLYAANTAVPASANEVVVDWTWAFSTDAATDAKDTALGNQAVSTPATIDFKLSITVEQVEQIS